MGAVDDVNATATMWRNGGSVFHFARDKENRWGLADLDGEWDAAKLRATHDLEQVRQNAETYRKSRAKAGAGK
jgi:hypothetical protein